jgi:hypothetical protein
MNFQLVIQFHPAAPVSFDELVTIEDAIATQLGASASVDGHDIGGQECNIFILTENPTGSFQRIQKLLQEQKPEGTMNVAYRDTDADDHVVLWPPNLREFTVA